MRRASNPGVCTYLGSNTSWLKHIAPNLLSIQCWSFLCFIFTHPPEDKNMRYIWVVYISNFYVRVFTLWYFMKS